MSNIKELITTSFFDDIDEKIEESKNEND